MLCRLPCLSTLVGNGGPQLHASASDLGVATPTILPTAPLPAVPMAEVGPSLAATAADSSRDAKGKAAVQPSRRVTRSSKVGQG